jgi:hypothetical protein
MVSQELTLLRCRNLREQIFDLGLIYNAEWTAYPQACGARP